MPNRIIRDSILDSDRYLGLKNSDERLLFVEILLLADDYGICPAGFGFLRRRTSVCSGLTESQVSSYLESLHDADLIRVYVVDDDRRFLFVPRFGNSPRAQKPKWPLPVDISSVNEIKALQEKRIADVSKRKANASKCISDAEQMPTNAPETETETETVLKPIPPLTGAHVDAHTHVRVATTAPEIPKPTEAAQLVAILRRHQVDASIAQEGVKIILEENPSMPVLLDSIERAKAKYPGERIGSKIVAFMVKDAAREIQNQSLGGRNESKPARELSPRERELRDRRLAREELTRCLRTTSSGIDGSAERVD